MRAVVCSLAVALLALSSPVAAAKPPTPPSTTAAKPAKPTVGLTEEAEAGIAQTEAMLLAGLASPSTLMPHLADRHAVEGYIWSKRITKPTEDRIIADLLEEQRAAAPTTTAFAPDRCFSAASLGANERVVLTTEEMVFFEGNTRTSTMFWVQVQPDVRTLLLSPPMVDDARPDVLERWYARVRADDATMYVKKDGAWQAAKAPAKSAPTCDEVLKTAARQVYVAEESYRAEQDTYTTDLAAAGVTVADGITAKVRLASNTAFVVELRLKAGVVTIDDQNALTVISSCAP